MNAATLSASDGVYDPVGGDTGFGLADPSLDVSGGLSSGQAIGRDGVDDGVSSISVLGEGRTVLLAKGQGSNEGG